MDEPQFTRMRTYAWNYFAYHADQRMKTLQFYLVMVAALAAGIVALLTKTPPDPASEPAAHNTSHLPSSLCFLITFLSVIFLLLDRRNAQLVKNGERALSHLDSLEGHPEESDRPHVLALFIADDHATKVKPTRKHISYSDLLKCLFIVFGGLALLMGFILW